MISLEFNKEQQDLLLKLNITTDYTNMTEEEAEEMFDIVEDYMQTHSDNEEQLILSESILDLLCETGI